MLQYQERGRGHNSTRPRRIIPSTPSSTGEKQPYHDRGKGHNRTRPRRVLPSTPSSKREKQQYQEGGRGHNSTRPRRIIPSTTSSKWETQPYRERGGGTTVPDPVGSYCTPSSRQQYREGGRGHNGSRPRRILPSTESSTRENAAVLRDREGGQQYQTP